MEDIIRRLHRIYAALGAAEEWDLSKLKGLTCRTDKVVGLYQDFRGGLSNEQLDNMAHGLIHNVANLGNHVRRWLSQNGKDASQVDQTFKGSFALQVISDLSNNDKHGWPARNGGHSGRSPRLVEVNRVLCIRARAGGPWVAVTLRQDGTPAKKGEGSVAAILSGDVVGSDGGKLGDVMKIAEEAIGAWERLLVELGVIEAHEGDG